MMYMHYCPQCHFLHMLNGHRLICPRCLEGLVELKISYLDYAAMKPEQRKQYLDECKDPDTLAQRKTTYRMYRYSKWYKEAQKENVDNLPIVEFLSKKYKAMRETLLKEENPYEKLAKVKLH